MPSVGNEMPPDAFSQARLRTETEVSMRLVIHSPLLLSVLSSFILTLRFRSSHAFSAMGWQFSERCEQSCQSEIDALSLTEQPSQRAFRLMFLETLDCHYACFWIVRVAREKVWLIRTSSNPQRSKHPLRNGYIMLDSGSNFYKSYP